MPHIYSEFAIGTILAINLRQAASEQLSFVSFEEQVNVSSVVLDGRGVTEGEYSLTIESFNTLSIA